MRSTSLVYCLLCFANLLICQNDQAKWYFGKYAALDFMNNSPTPLLNSVMDTGEGSASVADSAGNLLFYTNGDMVYNSNHQVMANGANVGGGFSSVQPALIIKDLQLSKLYHLFTTFHGGYGGLAHSVIDMSLAAGLGSVTVKNYTLDPFVGERVHGTRHCNGRDWWIIAHRHYTNEFIAFLLTPNGLQATPVVSATGPVLYRMGTLKVSPTGNKIGVADGFSTSLFDFDPASGQVSNQLLLDTLTTYGCEFSPDGTKFYATQYMKTILEQWALCGTDSAIKASRTLIFDGQQAKYNGPMAMQLGPDKKLYVCMAGSPSVGVVHQPNLAGVNCSFTPNSLSLGGKLNNMGFPNFITLMPRPQPAVSSSLQCGQASFNYSLAPLSCAAQNLTPAKIHWRFGDADAKGKDTSSLVNPSYTFPKNGSYTVSLILEYSCTKDTFKIPLTVTDLPGMAVSGRNKICQKESTTLTASGAVTYTWSSGQQSAAVILSPSITTVYTVSGTNSNSCQASIQHSLAVSACLGIAAQQQAQGKVYPNPAGELLTAEGYKNKTIRIIDVLGTTHIRIVAENESEQIDISRLPKGVYFVEVDGTRQAFVKE